MAMQDDPELVDAMTFPKVTVRHGVAGHLTPLSAKLILIELGRKGFVLQKAPDSSRTTTAEKP